MLTTLFAFAMVLGESQGQSCDSFRAALNMMNAATNDGQYGRSLQIGDSLLKANQKECKDWVQLHIHRGKLFAHTEKFDKAFEEHELALDLSKDNPELQIEINMHIGSLYRRTAAGTKDLEYLRKALIISKKEGIETFYPDLYNSYGNAVSYTDMDSGIYYYEKALEAHGDKCPRCRSTIINNIGSQYAATQDLDQAIVYFNRAYAIDTAAKDSLRLMRTLMNLGRVEYAMGAYGAAKSHLEVAVQLAKKYDWNMSIPFMTNFLGGIEASKGNYEASYELIFRAAQLQDSITRAQASDAVAKAKSSFDFSKSEMENDLLLRENEVIKRNQRLRSTSLILAALVALFLGALVVISAKQRKKLSALNQSLDTQNDHLKELLTEKDTFMGMLTHDLRTPLGNTVAILGMLQENDIPKEERDELFKDAEVSAESARDLLNDLITLYQVETQNATPELEEFEMGAFLKKTCEQYQVMCLAKGQEFVCAREDRLFILSNRTMLKSVVGNLISNAIKYSPLGGKVEVSAWREENKIKVAVRDSGPGFTDEDKKALFGKFQRLSAQPTGDESSSGLGLHLVKLMVDKLEGQITLESRPGVGSTFTVTFTAAND